MSLKKLRPTKACMKTDHPRTPQNYRLAIVRDRLANPMESALTRTVSTSITNRDPRVLRLAACGFLLAFAPRSVNLVTLSKCHPRDAKGDYSEACRGLLAPATDALASACRIAWLVKPGWSPLTLVAPPFRVLCEGWELKLNQQPARGLQRRANCFDFCILLQRFMAHFASPSRLFVSTEGQGSVENVVAVDPHRAGAELSRQTMRLLDVARPYPRSQPINRYHWPA